MYFHTFEVNSEIKIKLFLAASYWTVSFVVGAVPTLQIIFKLYLMRQIKKMYFLSMSVMVS